MSKRKQKSQKIESAPPAADFSAHRAKRKANGHAKGVTVEHQATAELPPPAPIATIDGASSPPTAIEQPQVVLGPVSFIEVHACVLAAAISILPKNGKRPELEGVYVEQLADGDVRLVATDGHRLLVQTYQNAVCDWARGGVIIPRAQLESVLKFTGKKEEVIAIGFGEHHDKLTLRAAFGTFAFAPTGGSYPDYSKILAQAGELFASERETLDACAVNPKYLKQAGAIGAQLGSEGVRTLVGAGSDLIVFTFAKVPGCILVQMGLRTEGAPALEASVAKLIGAGALKGTLAALKAHQTRWTKAAKGEKNEAKKAAATANAERFGARIAEIMAGLAPAIAAPTEEKPAAEGGAAA